MAEFLKVLSAVLPVFLIALLGFQLRRMDWLTKAADDSLLKVSVNVLLPCLAFQQDLAKTEALLQAGERLAAAGDWVFVGRRWAWPSAGWCGSLPQDRLTAKGTHVCHQHRGV